MSLITGYHCTLSPKKIIKHGFDLSRYSSGAGIGSIEQPLGIYLTTIIDDIKHFSGEIYARTMKECVILEVISDLKNTLITRSNKHRVEVFNDVMKDWYIDTFGFTRYEMDNFTIHDIVSNRDVRRAREIERGLLKRDYNLVFVKKLIELGYDSAIILEKREIPQLVVFDPKSVVDIKELQ